MFFSGFGSPHDILPALGTCVNPIAYKNQQEAGAQKEGYTSYVG